MAYQRFDYGKCREMAALVFRKIGLSPEDSEVTADALLEADLFGIESHGIQRLGMYVFGVESGRIKPAAKPGVVRDLPSFALVDAHEGMGQPVSVLGMNMAVGKAEKTGFGMVIVRNSTHFGSAGHYSRLAADRGMFGMCMTNTEALVVPTHGRSPMLGTNPLAVSMPASPVMFHMDIATSVVTAGKMEVTAKAGKPIPDGWCVAPDGTVATDPETFLRIRSEKTDGGILPLGGFGELFGGHKGYGMSMLVEILTGVMGLGFTSASVRKVTDVERCCHMFQAIDYSVFGDREEITAHFSRYLRDIRESGKAEGCDRIYIHGEKEAECRERALRDGVPMQEATVRDLREICRKFGIDPEQYMLSR